MTDVTPARPRSTTDRSISNDDVAPVVLEDSDCAWGSCSAEPYWLDIADTLEPGPEEMPGEPPC